MQRKITIEVDVGGNNTGASDFEGRVQFAAQKAIKQLALAPLLSGADINTFVESGITGYARVSSVVADSGLSDA